MKKLIALLLCLLMILCCFTGCKKDEVQTEEQTTVETDGTSEEETADETAETEEDTLAGQTLTVYTDLTEEAPAYAVYMEQVTKFEEANGCTVTVNHYGKDLALVLDNALKNGSAVDVFPVATLSELSMRASYALDLSEHADELEETAYAICLDQVKALSGGEKIYAVPTVPSVHAMWYNKASFEKAGIKEAPTSVKEFEAVCDELVEAGFQPIALDSAYVSSNFAVHMERALGAQTVAELVANGGWANNKKAAEACQTLIDWVDKGYFDENAPADWPFSQLSLADRTVMIFADTMTLDMAEEMIGTDLEWGCFAYPGDSKAVQADFAALCINAETAVPELAWEFVRFMTAGEADQAVSDAAGIAPADRNNTSETYGEMTAIAAQADALCDYNNMLKGSVDLTDVIKNIYAGTYATGEEAVAALDALY